MKGTFDNEIKAAITGNKGNVNSGNNSFGKAKGGKKFGKQKPVANSAAKGGKKQMPGVRVPSGQEEIDEGEMPMAPGQMQGMPPGGVRGKAAIR